MDYFAVIGDPIDHSLSPQIHQCFAKQTGLSLAYEKIRGYEDKFEQQVLDFFAQKGRGMNVTLPFKQRAFAMAKVATPRCKSAGAGNTLWMRDKSLWIDNTDGIGLVRDLQAYLRLEAARILILGAGGAARGIILPLLDQKPSQLLVANRSSQTLKALLQDFPQIDGIDLEHLRGSFDLIINATSAGLKGEQLAVAGDCFKNKPFCYDLSYARSGLTAFVEYAKTQDCPAQDGLGMLVEQAAEAFYIWNGLMPDTQLVLKELRT